MKIILLLLAALLAPTAAVAADQVALESKIYVERTITGTDGLPRFVREEPTLVIPGETLLFVLSYKNAGTAPAEAFVVTNPIPNSVSLVGADSDGADFSIDGGKSWGALPSLKVKAANGSLRPALAADVTHIRWIFAKAIPVGGTGTLKFRGVVK